MSEFRIAAPPLQNNAANPQEMANFASFYGILRLARQSPSFLPILVNKLSGINLEVYKTGEGRDVYFTDPSTNRNFFRVGASSATLTPFYKTDPGVTFRVASMPGLELFEKVSGRIYLTKGPVDMEVSFRGNQGTTIEKLIIPGELFYDKKDPNVDPARLKVRIPQNIITGNTREAFHEFLSMYPEISAAYYVERSGDRSIDHIVVLQSSLEQSRLERFLFTVPVLLMGMHGFDMNRTWVKYLTKPITCQKDLQRLYERRA